MDDAVPSGLAGRDMERPGEVEPANGEGSRAMAYVFLVAASAMFASGYPLARAVDASYGMDMLVAQGMVVSAILLSLTPGKFAGSGMRPHIWPIVFNGVGSAATCFMVMEGSRVITPSLAAVIVISNALMVAALAWALGRKKFTAPQLVALCAGFAGVVWVSVERGALGGQALGVAYLLMAAALIALMTIAIEKPLAQAGGVAVTRMSFWIAAVVSIGVLVCTGRFASLTAGHAAVAVFFGVICTGVPSLLFNEGMIRVGSADAAAFKLLIPVFAFVYGVGMLGESPSASSLVGGLLVVASVAAYQAFSRKAG